MKLLIFDETPPLPSISYPPISSTTGMYPSAVILELKIKINTHPFPLIYKEANMLVSYYYLIYILVDDNESNIKTINTLTYHNKWIKDSTNHQKRCKINHFFQREVHNRQSASKIDLYVYKKKSLQPCQLLSEWYNNWIKAWVVFWDRAGLIIVWICLILFTSKLYISESIGPRVY